MNSIRSTLLVFCMCLSIGVSAQTEEKAKKGGDKPDYSSGQRKLSLGIEVGTTMPYTDVTQYQVIKVATGGPISEYGYNFGLILQKQISPVFSFFGRLNYGQLQGYRTATTDYNNSYLDAIFEGSPNHGRSITSQTPLILGELGLIINFSNISFNYNNADRMKKYLWYGSFGFGGVAYDPTLEYAKEGLNDLYGSPAKHSDNLREVSGSAFPLFFGFGFRRHLSASFDLGLEYKLAMTNSDVIDGAFLPGSSNDTYGTINVTLLHHFKPKDAGDDSYALHWVHPTDMLLNRHHDDDDDDDDDESEDASEDTADNDGDGVPNSKDEEPFTRYGAQVDERGIALDDDKDGVPNGIDKENDTPEGVMVNYFGQHIKIPTTSPQAGQPTTPSPTDNPTPSMSRPNPVAATPNADVAYYPSMYFGTNSTAIRADDAEKLVRVGRTMQNNASIRIKLVGHADKTGPVDYNKMLAEKRVQAVKNFLINNLHIDASRIETEVKGDSDPVSKTLNYVNRRVDIIGA